MPADRRLGGHPNRCGQPARRLPVEADTVGQLGTSEPIVTETETEAEEKR